MKRRRVEGGGSSIDFDASKLPPLPRLPDKHAQRPFLHPTFAASQLGKKHPEITKNLRSEVEFRSYEPYEFIGDRILSTFVITALKLLYPKATCGTLSKLNQLFTTNAMFAAFGYEYGFGDRILMSNGRKPEQKTVADAFEAYFGVLWYSELERSCFLGLSNTLHANYTNTLFPDEGSLQPGPSTSAKAAGKKKAREAQEEEEPQPFASMLNYVVDLIQNAFPTLSTWIKSRDNRRGLTWDQEAAFTRSKSGPLNPAKPKVSKMEKRRLKAQRKRENDQRKRRAYAASDNPAPLDARHHGSRPSGRTYETRSHLARHGGALADRIENFDDLDYEEASSEDDSDDDIIFIAVKGPATAESQAALRTPIRVIDLSEDTSDESDEAEDEEGGPAHKRAKYENRSSTPFNSRTGNNEQERTKLDSLRSPVIQESSDEEDEESSRSSSGEAENISATLIQKPADKSSSNQGASSSKSVQSSAQRAIGTGTTDQPFELSDDDSEG